MSVNASRSSPFDWLARALTGLARLDQRFWLGLEELALGLLDDPARRSLTLALHRANPRLRPGSAHNQRGLFPWEEQALAAHFPAPPAPLLVGGCGGGRQVLALLARGHAVTAFDPVAALVEPLQRELASSGPRAAVLTGSFEDLIAARPALVEPLGARAPFAGVVLGWTAFSNLLRPQDAAALLGALRRLAPSGPLLLSFFLDLPVRPGDDLGRRRLRRLTRRLTGRPTPDDAGLRFSAHAGFFRGWDEPRLARLAAAAGYQLVLFRDHGAVPHAVLQPVGPPPAPR